MPPNAFIAAFLASVIALVFSVSSSDPDQAAAPAAIAASFTCWLVFTYSSAAFLASVALAGSTISSNLAIFSALVALGLSWLNLFQASWSAILGINPSIYLASFASVIDLSCAFLYKSS